MTSYKLAHSREGVPVPPVRSFLRRPGTLSVLALAAAGVMSTSGAAVAAETDNIVPIPHAVDYAGCGYQGLSVCLTDNSEVYYYMDSQGEFKLEESDKDVVRSVLRSEYSPTHLAIHYDATPTFEGSGETDIIYQEGSQGIDDDADGMAWCNAKGNDRYDCDQQYVRIRGAGPYGNSGLVCHETGHAVGLVHGQNASPAVDSQSNFLHCMKRTVNDGEPLGTNNRQNINNTYPKP